ncbi:hypothetical protein NHP190003_01370 [Helicobacter sp. NHP19-003]|uniref:Secreted protein n=1 Tax=Helicobacter gastrocanis TaxID=2849641 RepID=A0ABM7S8L8_9HELI|nr:hypothetical protein NHP190003_01370 [Helicobacter sp. NHP19-003]
MLFKAIDSILFAIVVFCFTLGDKHTNKHKVVFAHFLLGGQNQNIIIATKLADMHKRVTKHIDSDCVAKNLLVLIADKPLNTLIRFASGNKWDTALNPIFFCKPCTSCAVKQIY